MLHIIYDQKQTPGKPLENRTKIYPQKYSFKFKYYRIINKAPPLGFFSPNLPPLPARYNFRFRVIVFFTQTTKNPNKEFLEKGC